MIKYEYKEVKGYSEKKFIENGHTMFESDVLQRLKRLAYLEKLHKNTEKSKSNINNCNNCRYHNSLMGKSSCYDCVNYSEHIVRK